MAYFSIGVTELGLVTAQQIFFYIRFPEPDAHAGTGQFRGGPFSGPNGRLTPSGEPGQQVPGRGTSSPDDGG